MPYQLVLATDLDGTFLEGDSEAKQFLYRKLSSLHEQVLLIYTTGRSVETVKNFCLRGYLPHPHFVLGDHGTHIVDGVHFSPVTHLQDPITLTWGNGTTILKELLRNDPGIQLQPIAPPYRVAYYYDPNRLQKQTLEKINQAGFDYILSCDIYLDILPRGVNKGSSSLNLINYLNINPDIAVTSGDSLNDLPLFQTGLKSIAVANSEPKLIEIVKQLNNVYLSSFPGVLGIIDGLKFYEKFELFSDSSSFAKAEHRSDIYI
jgi:hydroxymethylpyrimidine pyrophosphatase-like HAD family hydrolase